ncbi:MAG TPA: DUF1152 domain-containing protein [Candidatus Competibacter sp.]|nr:DUF1152 domain-containing protein [Candidatus Competibacter sp.]HUM94025.1 DUF1152 domain-containing protein [Candidatus Competibacter sp.]
MQIPFFKLMIEARSILIAGAGGGFDIASGIPIYLYLRNLNKEVVLANLSFTELPYTFIKAVCPGVYPVTEESADLIYFPEKHIFNWLRHKGENPIIYGFSKNEMGVLPLVEAYSFIIDKHHIDTLILVDGGTDSLMFGDETKVGTIVEDACSITAAAKLRLENIFLAVIGFGVEHDLNHHACLENISTLIKDGQYLGASALTHDMPEGFDYLDLVDYLNKKMYFHESIVTNSVASALSGEFGDFHPTRRTVGSVQFISAFMSLFWFFRLKGVASRIKFTSFIENSRNMDEVVKGFQKYRLTNIRRAYQEIPL